MSQVAQACSSPTAAMHGLHARPITCFDAKVSEAHFFLHSSHSVLVAAPLDVQRQQDADWVHSKEWRDGSMDLDFVLYDDTATSTDASTSTAADRNPRVDYSFLALQPAPARCPGQTIEDRTQALQGWIEQCFARSASVNVAERLASVSSRLAFDYESYLRTLASPDGSRCVRGLVAASSSGLAHHSTVALAIPLLVTQQAAVVSTVQNIVSLYAKFTNLSLRKPHHIDSLLIDLYIHLHVQGPPADERLSVRSERLSVHVRDGAPTTQQPVRVLLQNLVDFNSLPQFSHALHRGDGFMDYIPQLETALLHSLRHPFHFLSLVLGLSASFGNPIELCPAATADPAAQATSQLSLVRTASFCVVDRRTLVSFMIGLHYYSGKDLPSVGIVANQYTSLSAHGAPLRSKVKYAPGTAESLSLDKDGFFQVEELSRAVSTGIMDAMATLMATISL